MITGLTVLLDQAANFIIEANSKNRPVNPCESDTNIRSISHGSVDIYIYSIVAFIKWRIRNLITSSFAIGAQGEHIVTRQNYLVRSGPRL